MNRPDEPSPQKRSPAYIKAFEDPGFVRRDELRPVRLELELWKADAVQKDYGISSTIVVFGSARIHDPAEARRRVRRARRGLARRPGDKRLQEALSAAASCAPRLAASMIPGPPPVTMT
ncbi:MAG: hypothetical protein HY721_24540 [Planctomycetes bacterium]|nr:hypothetical protein [Planctomycetota bacterium]